MSRREPADAAAARAGLSALIGEPPGYLANEIQRVCLQLRATHPDARVLIVTAPRGREGATTVATLFAAALADIAAGAVLLVDANLRAPALGQRFGLNGTEGLRDWEPARSREGIHATTRERLSVMPAGTGAEGSLHALHRSGRLVALAARLRDEFAFVIWDTPPINAFPDARFLLPHADGVLVVAEADVTRLAELALLSEQVGPSGCPLLGVILNRTGRYFGGARPGAAAPAKPPANGLFADPDGTRWE